MMSDVYAGYRARLAELVAKRDAKNAEVAPLVAAKEEANAEAQEANARAVALAAEIQKVRGGQSWLDLKKEIGVLSKLLSGK
jgi:uncharacterized coiled-coil DUF342 family protein